MTAEISRETAGNARRHPECVETVAVADKGLGPMAFYGRCPTEDNQDPETSRGWQLSTGVPSPTTTASHMR